MLSIDEIRDEIFEYGRLINAPSRLLILPDKPRGDGSPHIEIIDKFYHYVVSERGQEYRREKTLDKDKFLYWVFSDITFAMSVDYELKNRIPNQDGRRLIFKKQLYLLNKLNRTWGDTEEKEIKLTLEKFPYTE